MNDAYSYLRLNYGLTLSAEKLDIVNPANTQRHHVFIKFKNVGLSGSVLGKQDFYSYLHENGFMDIDTLAYLNKDSAMIRLTVAMGKLRPDSMPDYYLEHNYWAMPDLLELADYGATRLLDSNYTIDNLIQWLASKQLYIPEIFAFADEIKKWQVPSQTEAEPDNSEDSQAPKK
jgi:hypothetical protein